ncbi:MAG: Hsp20 family protein [Sphingomonadaceae bacterium]|nr:Hsp20 family protein [Sphingomonadaceae bacterium]
MRAFDFTPYRRQMIGFDRLFDMLERNVNQGGAEGYPPFDIEKTGDDQFRIAIAVAGFRPDEIEITSQNATLIVTGRKAEENGERQWLHRGIAARAFERRFELADYIVVHSADLRDGLLTIELKREVPEAMKPRRIAIGGTGQAAANVNQAQPQQIEGAARQAA